MPPTTTPSVGTSFVIPPRTADAQTRASVIDGRRGRDIQWQWYSDCIRHMLVSMGCPTQDLDDVKHDFLIEKLERVCAGYRPDKGRFRAYLHHAVRNAWRDRLRQRQADQGRSTPLDSVAAEIGSERLVALSRREDLTILTVFFDRIFARFMHDKVLADVGFFLLRDWCLTGRDIEDAIAANNLTVGPEYARKKRTAAISAFAKYVDSQLNAEDYALIAEEALKEGQVLTDTARTELITGAFRWPSERKRLGTVALILRRLYLRSGRAE